MPAKETKLEEEALRQQAIEAYEAKQSGQLEKEPSREKERPQEEKEIREELHRIASSQEQEEGQDEVTGLVGELLELDDRAQLGQLIKIAFTKTPRMAVRVARGLNNPAVLDALHDVLVSDNNYKRLIEHKKV